MIRLGILGTSEIAFRRFLPAILKCKKFQYVGIASRSVEKAKKFTQIYGGRVYENYDELILDENIDAVYLPLPPALHYIWGKKALQYGKHIFMEKPFTISLKQSQELIEIAKDKRLVAYENYMYLYHNQLKEIEQILNDNILGKIHIYRMNFGFPLRKKDDFRYNPSLGGGALLDCGGYPISLARHFLGDTTQIVCSSLMKEEGFDVDMAGSATLENKSGQVAQIAFGMNHSYRCELEIWGSLHCLHTNRIFTAPDGYTPIVWVDEEKMVLSSDDSFFKSIQTFADCVESQFSRELQYSNIIQQAKLVNSVQIGEFQC